MLSFDEKASTTTITALSSLNRRSLIMRSNNNNNISNSDADEMESCTNKNSSSSSSSLAAAATAAIYRCTKNIDANKQLMQPTESFDNVVNNHMASISCHAANSQSISVALANMTAAKDVDEKKIY